MSTLAVELPDELVALLGSPEAAAEQARRALVLDLLRQARISQGKAARLLGVNRWDLLPLMAAHQIPSGPRSVEELRSEVDLAERLLDRG